MLYLCDLVFIFSLIFHNQSNNTFKTDTLAFTQFLEYLLLFLEGNVDELSEKVPDSKSSASGCCLTFA